jgi:hypothetical protein
MLVPTIDTGVIEVRPIARNPVGREQPLVKGPFILIAAATREAACQEMAYPTDGETAHWSHRQRG